MKKFVFYLMSACAGLSVGKAHANSLFYEKNEACETAAIFNGGTIEGGYVLAGGGTTSIGATKIAMSCQDLKVLFEGAQVINMALMPAMLAMQAPGMREIILADLAAAGLTLANPVVLGVTVIGAFGVVTVYFIMKKSMEECEAAERRQFEKDLLNKLKQAYPGVKGQNVPVEIRKDGGQA